MKEIFGDHEIVEKYQVEKGKIKKNKYHNKEDLINICARLEVMLTLKDEEVIEEIKKIETTTFKSNNSLSVVPKEEDRKERYNFLLNQLKILKALKSAIIQ